MSLGIVRASKFRHVHGDEARKDRCYTGVASESTGESNFIKANSSFLAYIGVGGGGPVVVHPLSKVERLSHSPACVNVHKQKVLEIEFSPFLDTLLATASEDGYVKISLVPEGGLTESIFQAAASLEGHQKKVHQLRFHPTANNVLASASYDNTIKVWDIERQAELFALSGDQDLTLSLDWDETGARIATSNKDKKFRIWDPRTGAGAAQATDGFGGMKSARCVWYSNLGLLGGFGFSQTSVRQYKVWDPRKFSEPLITKDIDQSAGVIMPFYDPDNSIVYCGGKGDGSIRYFEVVNEEPYIHFLSEYRSTESQKGLCFLPKRACDTGVCEIGRALRLMKDCIQPVSFMVPRKSDIFQTDIYPDTYAGIPSLSSEEWAAGRDEAPRKVSMRKDGSAAAAGGAGSGAAAGGAAAAATSAPAFVAQKSAAELQRELAAANARIAELEAEVAALKAR